jgi:hypothetical protein
MARLSDAAAKALDPKVIAFAAGPRVSQSLNWADVLCARTLWSDALRVADSLAFTEILEADAFQGGRVKEQVLARRVRDETETLIRKTLDRTFCHRCSLMSPGGLASVSPKLRVVSSTFACLREEKSLTC